MDIVCLSSDHWDALLWTNKEHIMSRLARKGHRILYVDPPTGLATLCRGRHVRPYSEKRLFHWTRERMPRLWVHSGLGFPLSRLSTIQRFVNPWLRLLTLTRAIKALRLDSAVLWIYHPSDVFFVGRLRERVVVYDCVDELAAWTESPRQYRSVKRDEARLLHLADLVFTSSRPLYEARRRVNPHTHLLQNVADYDHFSTAAKPGPIPLDIACVPKPIVGFVGALHGRKVDFELVCEVARRQPGWSLVLIGPLQEQGKNPDFATLPNIYTLGLKDYEALPNYLRAFDVCMIPYRTDNKYIRNVFPMKFFEFLATGKPVVATRLPSLLEFGHMVQFASSPSEFVRAVQAALPPRDEATIQQQLVLARQNSWDSKVARMEELVAAACSRGCRTGQLRYARRD